MNKLWFFIVMIFAFSANAQEKQIDYVIFSGKIINANQKVFTLKGLEKKQIKKLILDEEGNFTDTINTIKQEFVLFEGINNAYIQLSPGDNIKLTADANDYLNTLKFTGKGADLNNYLVGAENLYKEENLNYKEKYSKSEKEFTVFKKEWKQKRLTFLKTSEGLSEEFIEIEKRNIYYCYVRDFINYEKYHINYSKNDNFEVSDSFLVEFKDLDWENEQDYENCHFYPHLIDSRITNNFNKEFKNDNYNYVALLEYIINTINNQYIKDQLLYKNSVYKITYTKDLEGFYKVFSEGMKDEKLKSEITELYDKLVLLSKGQTSPKFINYENYNGSKNSLDDFLGKYVYIDVWASWCPPCTNEIPHFKKLVEKYKSKNVEFISISVDRISRYDKWRSMVEEEEMDGVQLFADKDWDSDFIKDYTVKTIPRYILLDPSGKIINSNAPRPSDSKLIDIFNELNF